MSEETSFYILYKNGKAFTVSQEEWEENWKRWWLKVNNIRDLN